MSPAELKVFLYIKSKKILVLNFCLKLLSQKYEQETVLIYSNSALNENVK